MRPLFSGFLATNIWVAFALNGVAAAIAVITGIFFKDYWDRKNNKDHRGISTDQMVITFMSTLAAAFLAYVILHMAFGFGGGMLVPGTFEP